jgi:RES domain-containing protein
VILWRIAAETRRYAADDMSGKGAATHPGRWNDDGQPVVYSAPTIAMAVLETAAHIDDGGLPLNRFVVRIDVPDAVWAARAELQAAALPTSWAAIPAGRTSVKIGGDWLRSHRSAILLVPSVIVPEECVALINPAHKDADRIVGEVARFFDYSRLFRPA